MLTKRIEKLKLLGFYYFKWSIVQSKQSCKRAVSKVKMAIIVEGDPKAPFSIATTPNVGEDITPSLDCSTLPLILTL